MTDKNNNPFIAPLYYQYPLVSKDSIPAEFNKLVPIDYKNKEIAKYEVLFFHRLMKKNYGEPSEIEYESDSIKELGNGSVTAFGREWKYYIRTRSGGIIQVGTEDAHTHLKICHLLPNNQEEPSNILIQESKKFVDVLLTEAGRQKGQLLNIKNEFESGDEKIGPFLLDNVYLTNYRRAELMLDYAEGNEKEIKEEALRYTPSDSLTPEQQAHLDKFMRAAGMYYDASIFYSWMALEGFVNIIYYAFLKDELKSDFDEENVYERLDIVKKILLMPVVCNGFKSEQKVASLEVFKKLKNYRNFLFHSKITDSLGTVCFVESGFLYTCRFKKDSNPFFLTREEYHLLETNAHVIKGIVDKIIVKEIIDMMQDEYRALVEKHVLNSTTIPFWRDKNGVFKLGTMEDK